MCSQKAVTFIWSHSFIWGHFTAATQTDVYKILCVLFLKYVTEDGRNNMNLFRMQSNKTHNQQNK